MILDEIPTALGRTGRMFACEHYDVVPDMLVLGKALGGGVMPLAALLAREHLNVAAEKAIGHYTHEKNPVAAAAGLATLEFIESERLLEHVNRISALALDRLRAMQQKHAVIGDVRGLGLILGVELVKERATMKRDTETADRVMYEALSRGLNFKSVNGQRAVVNTRPDHHGSANGPSVKHPGRIHCGRRCRTGRIQEKWGLILSEFSRRRFVRWHRGF